MSDKKKGGIFLLNATSADIDRNGKTYVVLYWTPRYDVSGYNLYRSKSGSISSRAIPINGRRPIAPIRTCKELKNFIHPRSREWQQLVNAFTSLKNSKKMEMVADSSNRARFKDSSLLQKLQKAPRLPEEFIPISPKGVPWEMDPCEAIDRGLTAEEDEMFEALAANSLNFRLARGLAYRDYKVEANEKYFYELRGVLAHGREVVLGSGLTVQAGRFILPEAPSGLNLTGGDSKVLALWNRNPCAAFSYRVCRSVHAVFGHQVIHEEQIQLDITHDLEGEELVVPQPGFLDYQRWDEYGLPEDHDVNGLSVSGPKNGYKYYYKVAGIDILGRQGSWCGNQSATPVSITPPKAPETLRVDPSTTPFGLTLSWRKVTHNIDNHQILESSQTYEIYRGETLEELENLDDLAQRLVGTVIANPSDPTVSTVSWTDNDPVLSPSYGEKDFWYRIRCLDENSNISFPSAVVGGRIPDTTAPGPTDLVDSEGFSDHIRIFWQYNSEPDLAGYQIYRAICDHGRLYQPADDEKQEVGCDMILVGTVSLNEQKACLAEGSVYFDDYSVPSDSPLCYAYWVRAYDGSQNLYMGANGCPKPEEYICQRLLEETPPPAPVITTLKARNKAVLIEWIASPIQDLRAFHVYRSEAEDDPGIFLGCVLSDGSSYPARWEGVRPACSDIPAEPNPVAVQGKFLDETPDPKRVYWYRVSTLDWLGNESEGKDLSCLPAMSTFTFLSDLPVCPIVLPQTIPSTVGCGLEVRWSPSYTPAELRGFVVFRSGEILGDYRQVSPIIEGNVFTDPSARRGVDYWYQIQAIDWAGRLSSPSAPHQHSY